MKPIVFSLYSDPLLTDRICTLLNYEKGMIDIHTFPDQESHVKINSDVKNRDIIFIAGLNQPNEKYLPLVFSVETAKDLGAKKIGLMAPYLPYMRQDKRFKEGEGITSTYFAKMISQHFNWILTIDPHLHRRKSMDEIYSIPSCVLHASFAIANWIKTQVDSPLIIGPDKESEQWVADIAQTLKAPYIILEKIRLDDTHVRVSLPNIDEYKNRTPILVDDIISSAMTMIAASKALEKINMPAPICIGVHAVFSGAAYETLCHSRVKAVITTNTIQHVSNGIDMAETIVKGYQTM